MSEPFTWEPLSPFGAQVDFDLRNELTPSQAEELKRLFYEHSVLLFRGQDLDAEQQRRIFEYIGNAPPDAVNVTSNDPTVGLQGDIKLAFHSDLAFAPEPDQGASLFAMDLVDDASSTSFASAIRAYARLPEDLKERIEGLEAISVWPVDQTRRNRLSEIRDSDPRAVHPVVWEHPVTGVPLLFLTEMQTDSIVGLPEEESEALIAALFGYLFAPDNILVHRWRVGDFVMWDNLATQHARDDVSQVGRRTLRRATLARLGFFEQFPQFRPTDSGYVDERHAETAAH